MVGNPRKLTAAERERIQAAIAAAERNTHARLAFTVVPVSDRYLLYPLLWGALLALLVGGGLAIALPHLALRPAFAILAVIFLGLSLAFDWLPLRLMLVPNHVKRAHAHNLAHREFASRILANREHRGGILLFVSSGERYIQLLADRDLHAKVGEAEWSRIVTDFVARMKRAEMSEGAVAAIASCGAILERHAPGTGTSH